MSKHRTPHRATFRYTVEVTVDLDAWAVAYGTSDFGESILDAEGYLQDRIIDSLALMADEGQVSGAAIKRKALLPSAAAQHTNFLPDNNRK